MLRGGDNSASRVYDVHSSLTAFQLYYLKAWCLGYPTDNLAGFTVPGSPRQPRQEAEATVSPFSAAPPTPPYISWSYFRNSSKFGLLPWFPSCIRLSSEVKSATPPPKKPKHSVPLFFSPPKPGNFQTAQGMSPKHTLYNLPKKQQQKTNKK